MHFHFRCRHITFYMISMFMLLSLIATACQSENDNQQVNTPEQSIDLQESNQTNHKDTEQDNENSDPPEKEATDPLQEKIKTMTLQEKVGQLVIAGVSGPEADTADFNLIDTYRVGGFIFFDRNIQDAEQWAALVQSLKKYNAEQGNIPLFLSVDEEGGRVSRIPEPYLSMPDNATIGDQENPELSYRVGSLLAEQVHMFGINVNFSPVLDVNSNPDNPVIGDRSFSPEPDIVSLLGIQTMYGMQDYGVIPVLKHFPGHGDTVLDSHYEMPVVDHGRERLANVEWKPFREAIDHGADAVMTAHVLFPQLDSEYPATLSSILLTDVLRQELGFEGVIITDDLTMGAITGQYEIGEAAIQSIHAGSDVLLVCHGYDNVEQVLNAIERHVQNGDLKEERIDESVYRILKLKEKYQLDDKIMPERIPPETMNDKVSQALTT